MGFDLLMDFKMGFAFWIQILWVSVMWILLWFSCGFLCIYRFMVVVVVRCCRGGGVGCCHSGWVVGVSSKVVVEWQWWVYGFGCYVCGFICGFGGFAWWSGDGIVTWWMLVWRWYCDVVVAGYLRGRGRKRNSKKKKKIRNKKEYLNKVTKKGIWNVRCVAK